MFSSEGNKAVYKPVLTLLILVRAQQCGENRFYFEQIEPKLRRLLRQFSSSSRLSCNYPFWYLQSDGYWEVDTELGAPKTRKGKSSEPTSKGLRGSRAYGTVPADLWVALIDDRPLTSDLAGKLIEDYWPSSIRDDLASAVGINLTAEDSDSDKRDPEVREKVLQAYNFKCAVCGFDERISSEVFGIEAAHIQARSKKLGNGPDIVQNGIALGSLHHKALDYGAISLGADLRILVSSSVSGSRIVSNILRDYANADLVWKPLQDTLCPGNAYTRWHRENLFRAPAIRP